MLILNETNIKNLVRNYYGADNIINIYLKKNTPLKLIFLQSFYKWILSEYFPK